MTIVYFQVEANLTDFEFLYIDLFLLTTLSVTCKLFYALLRYKTMFKSLIFVCFICNFVILDFTEVQINTGSASLADG